MNAKANAAAEAVKLVRTGMNVGLGTGSTAAEFIRLLAERAKKEALELVCVATSKESESFARKLGLKVVSLSEVKKIHLAVDGADQIDSKLRLVKGLGGGAITREKVVDYSAEKFVVIADEGKVVERLSGNVPIEVLPYALPVVERSLEALGAASASLREKDGKPLVSDNGNHILDVEFPSIPDPARLESQLNELPGTLENGIFTKNASVAFIGTEKGARRLTLP